MYKILVQLTLIPDRLRAVFSFTELELDPTNFAMLCESGNGGINCHLAFGHLGTFKSFNVDVLADAARWLKKILTRPLSDKE